MALVAMFLSLALVIALTLRDRELIGRSGVFLAVVMWLAAPAALLIKLKWVDWSTEKSLWVTSGLFLWVILCGLGRPAILLSTLFMDEPNAPSGLLLRSIISQAILVIGIIVFVAIDFF